MFPGNDCCRRSKRCAYARRGPRVTEKTSSDSTRSAVFFDVDGTIAKTTIVHYYAYFREQRMSAIVAKCWRAAFLLKCVYYLIMDKIDRGRLNKIFYRSYAGLDAKEIYAQAEACHQEVMRPKVFPEAMACIKDYQASGRLVVLVTGSIDFIIAPLAAELSTKHVLAPALVVRGGRFTGELDSAPVSGEEKVRRMKSFADEHDVDLAQSHAYGDSIADLPMLQAVGHPHAVNPDGDLLRTATQRHWPVHRWKAESTHGDASS